MSRIPGSARAVLDVLESLVGEGVVAAEQAPALAKSALFRAGEALDGPTIDELALRNLTSPPVKKTAAATLRTGGREAVRRAAPRPDFVDEEQAAIHTFLNKHTSLSAQEQNLPALADDYYRTFTKSAGAAKGQLVRRYSGNPDDKAVDSMLKQMMQMDDSDGTGTNIASAAFRTHYDWEAAKGMSEAERVAYMRAAENKALGNLRKNWNKPVQPRPKAQRSPSSSTALEPEMAPFEPPEYPDVPDAPPRAAGPDPFARLTTNWEAGGKGLPLSPSNLLGDDKPLIGLTKQARALTTQIETQFGIRERNIVQKAAGEVEDDAFKGTSKADYDAFRDYAGGEDPSAGASGYTRDYMSGKHRTDPAFERQFIREKYKDPITGKIQREKQARISDAATAKALDPIGMVEMHQKDWQKALPKTLFGRMDTTKFRTVTPESLVGAYLDSRKLMIKSALGALKRSTQAVENRMGGGRALAQRMSEVRAMVDRGPQDAGQWQKLLVLTHQRMSQKMGAPITFRQAWEASAGGRTLAPQFPVPENIVKQLGWQEAWQSGPNIKWDDIARHVGGMYDDANLGAFDAGTP